MDYRLASPGDAEQLFALNAEFNGPEETDLPLIRAALEDNTGEVVVVADDDGVLAGFLCVQLKKSFCYLDCQPEVTEVYVRENYRRQGVASGMMAFAEKHCREHYPLHRMDLLTGRKNLGAQAFYAACGYQGDGHVHMRKSIQQEENHGTF
ncbi:MAG: GNAT family N-acetyltransferase [Clostridia bacterium]|nr:GNAT family N-acetyltransferase [Clostridia bacterium]